MQNKMRFIYFLSITIISFAFSSQLSSETTKANPATIKILLEQGSTGMVLETRGSFEIINPATDKKISSGRHGKRFYLYPHKEGIKWGENFLGIYQIHIRPTSPRSSILIDGIQYRGVIAVYHVEEKLNVVNEIDVENFLKSALVHRKIPPLSDAVIDAIAIVARTHAYYTALLNFKAFWHLNAKTIGYQGYALTCNNLEIEHAIERTRHLVMTFDYQPFPATWTYHSAGKTASYNTIFRKNTPTPQGVKTIFAAKDRRRTFWTLNIESQELAQIMQTNRITGIELFVDPSSHKVYALKILDGMHSQNIDFLDLQQKLGQNRLRSNDFQVKVQGTQVKFEGYGQGTGVGLCLYSADCLAKRGESAGEILQTFFPGTSLEKMATYPEAIISSTRPSFISPIQKKRRLLK